MVRILGEHEITKEHISQIVALETRIYGKKESVRKYEEIHKKNTGVYNIVVDESNKAIGCIETIPVKSGAYKKLKSGKNDRFLNRNNVLSKKEVRSGKPINIYIGSVIVDPKYQNGQATFKLYNAFKEKMSSLNNEGVVINASLAHAVTKDGVKACKFYGMENIKSIVYEKKRVK